MASLIMILIKILLNIIIIRYLGDRFLLSKLGYQDSQSTVLEVPCQFFEGARVVSGRSFTPLSCHIGVKTSELDQNMADSCLLR